MVIRNAMRVDPTGPGEEGMSYLERSPALSRVSDYRTGNRAEGAGEVSRGHSSPTGRRAESSNARSRGLDSMNVEQQKGTTHHGGRGDGGTEPSPHGQQQALTAFDSQRALTNHLMEQVCDPQNLVRAYRRVRSNKGKPGVDGRTVD